MEMAKHEKEALRLSRNNKKGTVMFGWALVFLVVALVAALLGFGGIAGSAAGIAQILFWVGLVLFIGTVLIRLVSGRGSPKDLV